MQLLVTGPDGSQRKLDLEGNPVTVGRAPDNVLSYPDDPALSRYHLVIEPFDGCWQARDCGSRNGTVVNATPITKPCTLKAGDRVYAGQLKLELMRHGSVVSRATVSAGAEQRGATLVTTLDEVLNKARSATPGHEDSKLRTNQAVTALIRAGQELSGHRPLSELFEVILDLALSAVNARRGAIAIADPNAGLRVRASRGEGFSLSNSVRERVVRDRAALLIRDTQFDDALRNRESIVVQQIRSILAVPLQTGERVIGLIYADSATAVQPFSQGDLELLTVMANVAAIRIEHARLAQIEQEERMMQLELEQASEIQRDLLPEGPPSISGYEIAGYNLPCRAVGGDYYDFLPYANGQIGICIADVCGKGLPAALMMTSLQARVQILAESAPDPGAALTMLNRSLTPRFPMGRFITCFYGLLDSATGRFRYANAGHNYPLIRRENGDIERLTRGGLVLGLQPGIEYTPDDVFLRAGDTLLLYSDGVTEAPGIAGEHFGEMRLAEQMRCAGGLSCSEWIARLADEVRAWSGTLGFHDDFTAVLLRRS